jgi:hypothetical protein
MTLIPGYALFTCSQVSWFLPVLSVVATWTHVNATSENRQKPGLVFAGRRKSAKTSLKLDRGPDLRFGGFVGFPTPGFRGHHRHARLLHSRGRLVQIL